MSATTCGAGWCSPSRCWARCVTRARLPRAAGAAAPAGSAPARSSSPSLAALGALIALQGHAPDAPRADLLAVELRLARVGIDAQLSILVDPLSVFMILVVTGVSTLIHLYSVAYMDGDRGFARFFAYLNFFVFSMLLLVLAGNFLLLIVGWAFVGAASYLLISFWYRRTTATRGGDQGVRDQRRRRRRASCSAPSSSSSTPARSTSCARFARGRSAASSARHDDGDLVAGCMLLLVGRVRQVGADPAAHVAARRDGGPHAGQRADPRGHDGHRRRLPDRAHAHAVRTRARRAGRRRGDRRGDAADRRHDRPRADRHQARDRLLDDVADRLHDHGRLGRRLRGRAVPPDDPRLLQGAAVHGGRLADRRDGAASSRSSSMGGFRKAMPFTYGCFIIGGLALSGIPPFSGFFSKDEILLDHRRARRLALGAVRRRLHRRVPDRDLHLPHDLPRLPRRARGRGARAAKRATSTTPRCRATRPPAKRRTPTSASPAPTTRSPSARCRCASRWACSRSARSSPGSCRSRTWTT